MNPYIESVYAAKTVIGASGAEHPLNSEIDPEEGAFLARLIAEDPEVRRTLEVGCAFGMSSLHICHALTGRPGAEHTIIDPFQTTSWDGVGLKHLRESGITFFRFIEKKSEFALPAILEEGEGRFDLIFVDGMHTFDHTLLDCFYATRLLRVGGYLVVDDCALPPVYRALDYFISYPCYQVHRTVSHPCGSSLKRKAVKFLLNRLPLQRRKELVHPEMLRKIYVDPQVGMVALKKVAEDERDWEWFPAGF